LAAFVAVVAVVAVVAMSEADRALLPKCIARIAR